MQRILLTKLFTLNFGGMGKTYLFCLRRTGLKREYFVDTDMVNFSN